MKMQQTRKIFYKLNLFKYKIYGYHSAQYMVLMFSDEVYTDDIKYSYCVEVIILVYML